MSFVSHLKSNLINIPGWRTKRKIVVFESDDWGATRMPNRKTYEQLLSKGIRVDRSQYDTLDALESQQDLELLFEVLAQHCDFNGNHPVFTTNMVMGNPDFSAIRAAGFECFFHQFFLESYRQYNGEDLTDLWQQAVVEKIVQPQFHAREHLNSFLWMKDLRNGHPQTRLAFDYRFYGLKTTTGSLYQKNYLAAYRSESREELQVAIDALQEGLDIFEKFFGFRSSTFIACNYVWPAEIESFLKNQGVLTLQGQIGQIMVQPQKAGKSKIKRHYTGQVNQHGQYYTVRNVLFEPFDRSVSNWLDHAMQKIATAFFWQKPAIISTHRVNYSGGMSTQHRDHSLKLLDQLLSAVETKFPDVEYMSSDSLARLMHSN